MKKITLLLFATLFVSISYATMTVTQSGNVVTFTFDDNAGTGDWDQNGNPINLYLYTDNGTKIAGNWPGKPMTDQGGGIYVLQVDLANFFSNGVTVSEIKYIFNNGLGDQNPSSGGFLATAVGFTPVTIATTGLSNLDSSLKLSGANGKVSARFDGSANVQLYSAAGQLIRSVNAVNEFSENVQAGMYIVRVNGATHKVMVK